MSNLEPSAEANCECLTGCGAIEFILKPKDRDLGGFSVRRLLPNREVRHIGPWVFFDHMGPADFEPGTGIDVRPHPHINIATVTYLFEGSILHKDSLGSIQVIRPGDINLMVAGRGIVHSERETKDVRNSQHRTNGLQLWLALPEDDEEIDPSFHHYSTGSIPTVEVDAVPVRVMMGEAYGVESPVKTFSSTLYIEAKMTAGQRLVLPNAEQRGLYLVSGSVKLLDTVVETHSMVVLKTEPNVCVEALEETQIALIGGSDIGQRHIDWNFVSSRPERIEQAIQDWKAGKFKPISTDNREYIPYPG
ncbi:pirin family protein [Porticoccaceae bacterium LTM1]|nr:pirin family protein [Porticoccaceae bacterium LTM1]